MSWKLFWQIVLLMVIGALVLMSLKCALKHGKRSWGRCGMKTEQMQKKMPRSRK